MKYLQINNMGRIVISLYCLIFALAGCASYNSVLQIETYPSEMPVNEIGKFDIFVRRCGAVQFYIIINYDLKKDIILYADSVKIFCYHRQINDVSIIDDLRKDNPLRLSNKSEITLRSYMPTRQNEEFTLYTKNAIYTPSGVFPLDSVRFIQRGRYKFKDNFVNKKGKEKYGYYKISL